MIEKHPAIVFFGDSFCASYDLHFWEKNGDQRLQSGTTQPTHPSIVSSHFGWQLLPYGFGGRSWWYSHRRFYDDLDSLIEKFDIQAIVFFHTESERINFAGHIDFDSDGAKMYYGPYFDLNFHYWAHQQWFKQINQQFGDLKTIHFHCFSETVKWSDYLPGCVFTTPLINFSIGELTGSDNEIRTNVGTKEVRPNHFNAQNNQAIANLIIKNIKDYQPGKYTIDPKLFHQVNPNSFRFPEPGFGTK